MDAMAQEMALMKSKLDQKAAAKTKVSQAKLLEKKLTYKEKQQLKADIFQLPSDQLQPVIDIISKHSPPDQVHPFPLRRHRLHSALRPPIHPSIDLTLYRVSLFDGCRRATVRRRLPLTSTNCKCQLCVSCRVM
jgi:hypothetical protein